MKKLTKKEKFAIVRSIVEASAHENVDMLIEFIDHEVELLNRKTTGERKPTATQKQNEVLKVAIVEAIEPETRYTVSDIIKEVPECAGLTPQKVSPLMRQLEEEAKVERVKEKGKTYFVLL